MAVPIDDFMAGKRSFLAGVKGIGYTPGELGFHNMVYPGKRAIGNQITTFKGGKIGNAINDTKNLGTSYWWNLDAQINPDADIYKIASRFYRLCKQCKGQSSWNYCHYVGSS
jgi:hypothetical protein